MTLAIGLILVLLIAGYLIFKGRSSGKNSGRPTGTSRGIDLTPAQREQFLLKLGGTSAGTIYVTALSDDHESLHFAQELNYLLKEAGSWPPASKPVAALI